MLTHSYTEMSHLGKDTIEILAKKSFKTGSASTIEASENKCTDYNTRITIQSTTK